MIDFKMDPSNGSQSLLSTLVGSLLAVGSKKEIEAQAENPAQAQPVVVGVENTMQARPSAEQAEQTLPAVVQTENTAQAQPAATDMSQVPEIISSQFGRLAELEESVARSVRLAEEAKGKAEAAQIPVRWYKNKTEAIRRLQNTVHGLADAQITAAEAQKLLFAYQAKLAEITKYLFDLGIGNLAMNRCVVRELELKLKGASAGEISDLARQELKNVVAQLREREDIMLRQQKTDDHVREQGRQLQRLDEEFAAERKASTAAQRKIENMEQVMPNVHLRCKNCGKPMSMYQMVCTGCGAMLKELPYDMEKFSSIVKEKSLERMNGLAQAIQSAENGDEDWLYDELYDEFLRMKKIMSIADAGRNSGKHSPAIYKRIYDRAEGFFADYKKLRIEVAVVGTVKSGKSSLINALIGTKLASVDPTPETSTLVKYRTTASGNYLKVSFYSENEWSSLWRSAKDAKVFREEYEKLNAESIKKQYLEKPDITIHCSSEELPDRVMEWSKSDEPKHFFVRELEVGYQSDTFPHDVYLVDTPGLSDPVKYRSDITKRYIKKSDWILACITGENLSGQPEFDFLSKVVSTKNYDKGKVFVVATKKDMLTVEEAKEKADEFLARLGELYGDPDIALSRFTFVAAECHLLTEKVARGDKLEDQERRKLRMALGQIDLEYYDINTREADIIKYAGVKDLFDRIDKVVLQNRRALLIEKLRGDYNNCMAVINKNAASYLESKMSYLKEVADRTEIDQNRIDELKRSNQDIEELQNKVEDIRKQLEEQIQRAGIETEG